MQSISIWTKHIQVEICEHPIFIIGSPRSGTSILAAALAQHSNLWASDETQILFDLFDSERADTNYQRELRNDKSWLREQGIERAEFLKFLGLGLNALITSRSNSKRWIDHTPIYTLIADIISDLFPGAIFIHILRDARKVINSMINYKNVYKIHPSDMAHFSWAFDFTAACITWVHDVETAMSFSRTHSDRCLTVSNEALVTDTEAEFRRIFDFVQVQFEYGPPMFIRSNRWNSSYSQDGKNELAQDIYAHPSRNWTIEQRNVFLQVVAPTITRYSFPIEDDQALLTGEN
jgi:hypothetical protein